MADYSVRVQIGPRGGVIKASSEEELTQKLQAVQAKYGDEVEVLTQTYRAPEMNAAPGSAESTGSGGLRGWFADLGSGILSGFAQGATLGMADELGGLVTALGDMGGDPVRLTPGAREALGPAAPPLERSDYEIARDTLREGYDEAREAAPWAYGAGELAGALGAMLPAAGPATWAGRLGAGAVEGAAYGYGLGEGETAGEIAGDVGVGGLMGAGAAAAAPVLGAGLRAMGRGARGAFNTLTATPERQARREVRRALARDLLEPDDIDAIRRGSPEAQVLDLGPNTTGLAETVAQRPGPGQTKLTRLLEDRNTRQQGRLERTIRETVAPEWGEDFHEMVRTLDRAGAEAAAPLYRSAYAQPVRMTENLSGILDNEAMQPIIREAQTRMVRKGARGDVVGGNVEFLDQLQRVLRDKADAAYRDGERELGSDFAGIRRRLLAEVDAQVPDFAAARSVYRGSRQLMDAAEAGRGLFRGNRYAEDVADEIRDYSESEMRSFRVGAIRGMIDKIKKAGDTHDAAKRLINSTQTRELMALAFPDDARSQRFFNAMETERDMFDASSRILRNSATARRQMQAADAGGALVEVAGAAGDAAMGNKVGLVMRGLRRLMGGRSELSDETLEVLADMLTEELSAADIEDLLRMAPAAARQRGANVALQNQAGAMAATPLLIENWE